MSYSTEVLADSPLVYWKLDDTSGTTVVDSSGGSHNGVYVNTPTLNVAALINAGSAVTFASTSSQAIHEVGAIPTGSGSILTVEAWIKTSQSGSGNPDIFTCDNSLGGARNWQTRLSTSGKAEVVWFSGGTGTTHTGSVTINDGVRHHVVFVRDGTKSHIYVDGVEDGTGLSYSSAPPTADLDQLAAACRTSGGSDGNFFNGTLDELALYKTALSSTRIAAHHTAGASATVTGAAALTGTGSLTVVGAHTAYAAAALTGTGSVTVAGVTTRFGAAAFVGTGSIAVSGFQTAAGAASLAGLGSLAAAGGVVIYGTSTLTGVGSIVVSGARVQFGIAALTGLGSMIVTGTVTAAANALPGDILTGFIDRPLIGQIGRPTAGRIATTTRGSIS